MNRRLAMLDPRVIKTWIRKGRRLTFALTVGVGGCAAEEPDGLRVRLRTHSRHELRVLQLDPHGLHLRPAGSATGEIVVPLAEAADLQFVLPPSYREAQQLAWHGRPDEALLLLEPVVPPLVPFLAAPGGNAAPAVAFYLDLLMGQQRWDEALALARRFPFDGRVAAFIPKIMQLARALGGAGRVVEAAALADRIRLDGDTARFFPLLDVFADELRRGGHFTEAQVLYERLRPHDPPEGRARRALVLAYTDYHQGQVDRTAAVLDLLEEPETDAPVLALYLLLSGRLALVAGQPAEALDRLGRALVIAGGAGEWNPELLATIATAYRRHGSAEVADSIEDDLRRLYPGSRWTPPEVPPAVTEIHARAGR